MLSSKLAPLFIGNWTPGLEYVEEEDEKRKRGQVDAGEEEDPLT